MLDGRDDELGLLEEDVRAIREGGVAVRLLHGEPGIGKSSLLDAAAARADGCTVLRVRGHEADAPLAFAALRTLVEPILTFRTALPPQQAAALGSAFAVGPAVPPDRLTVAVALLGLLGAAAADRPVLALVDDVHWLDAASREVLLFAARRLAAPRTGMLLATREGEGVDAERQSIDLLRVGPVDEASARRIVRRRAPALAAGAVEDVVRAARGNPLALCELPAGLLPPTPAPNVGGEPLAPGPLVERAFARRLSGLPGAARAVATVAAAMDAGPTAWLLRALEAAGADAAGLPVLEREGVVVVDGVTVAFRHPLLRAVAYHAAAPEDLHAAHRALAATAGDPARRAWHLAAAARDADEAVAAELESAAAHARAVGGHLESAAAYARAAELSPDAARRALRRVDAARGLAVAGRGDEALALLDLAEHDAGPGAAADLARLRGNLMMRRADPAAAIALLVDEAERRSAAGDAAGAVAVLLDANMGPMLTGDLELADRLVALLRREAAIAGGEGAVLLQVLEGGMLAIRGRHAAAEPLLAAVAPRLGEVDLLHHSELVGMAAQVSLWLGADRRAAEILEAMVDAYTRAGALGRLPYPLGVRAQLRVREGRLPEALDDARTAARLAEDTEQAVLRGFALGILARIEALMGLESAAEHVAAGLRIVEADDIGAVAAHVYGAHGLLLTLQGRFAEAVGPLLHTRAFEQRHGARQPAFTGWAAELPEALLGAGRRDEALSHLAELRATAADTGSAWAAAVAARWDVLVAEDDADVPRLAELAAERAAVEDVDLERARTELAIGRRLRRLRGGRGRRAAQEHLLQAAAALDRLGARPFAEQAQRELRAAGLAGPPDAPASALEQLTAEEREIARLVASGATNREIAATLVVGQKTLERRLTGIYGKLGVTSRTELAALAPPD